MMRVFVLHNPAHLYLLASEQLKLSHFGHDNYKGAQDGHLNTLNCSPITGSTLREGSRE